MALTVHGLTKAQERLRAMAARVRDMSAIMPAAAASIATLIDDSFRGQREPGGRPWTPLQPETLARRLARKRSMSGAARARAAASEKILIDTGRLRLSSFASPSGPRSIRFGTNTVYAATHQLGRGAIPPRPFLPVTYTGTRFELTETGPAGVAFQKIRQRIIAFIKSGSVR